MRYCPHCREVRPPHAHRRVILFPDSARSREPIAAAYGRLTSRRELVARQLGHADVAMVAKVYGRFAPRSDERDRWERIAAEQDKKSTHLGTAVGTGVEGQKTEKAHKSLDSHTFQNSRGGTRTHDPGIMSAVL
jgi:hypothetical protein